MIGIVVLALLAGYLYLVGKTMLFIAGPYRPGQSYWKRGILLIIIAILPFVDEIIGRVQFNHECKKAVGYTVYEAIKGTQLAKNSGWPPLTVQIPALIPITKRTSRIIDVKDDTVVMTFDTLSTPGGWVMRAGLNLGNSSYCDPVNDIKIMAGLGFERVNGGFYQRTSVGDSK